VNILFDQGTPTPLRTHLPDHEVTTAFERGWATLTNGELLAAAEDHDFDVLITTDQSLKYQQNIPKKHLAVIVLLSTSWPRIQHHTDEIQQALGNITPGDWLEISIS
jgi:hypothetical protein